MDIKLPKILTNTPALSQSVDNPLALKIGQKNDAQVLASLIKAEINTLILKLANETITVQSPQDTKLQSGQNVTIQVTKTSPVVEFAIIDSALAKKSQTIPTDLRLKLIAVETDKTIPESAKEISLPLKQPLPAKIIEISGNTIKFQILTLSENSKKPQNSESPVFTKPSLIITVDRSQLQLPKSTIPSTSTPMANSPNNQIPDFKVGQTTILEVDSLGATPKFKVLLSPALSDEEKVTEFVKQFLPKHENSPVLLNHLLKDFPILLAKENIPATLQRLANEILENLPQRQQLNESPILKESFNKSGLFLEAKIQELVLNPEIKLEQDFKAGLLKLIHEIKNVAGNPEKTELKDTEIVALKRLQQSLENNIAKINLDQLASLPKDENPKQVWTVDIPFRDRGQAETVSLQISREKENEVDADNNKWSVTLTMKPPGLGTIQCILSYFNETIYTNFSSNQANTTELISNHLDHLRNQLESAGLKTGNLNIQTSLDSPKSAFPKSKLPLFDEKA